MKHEQSINNFFLCDGQTALPKFTHGSLFSGIGGFDLAASWMGWENVFHCEINEWARKVLKKNFPESKSYDDIKKFDGTKYTGAIDILTGGFPCQPFSVAGKRKGKEDDRYLWPEMLRVIGEIKPTFVIGENVSGSWVLVEQISNDLEEKGYQVEPIDITACAVGANHIRERYWFLAHSIGTRYKRRLPIREEKAQPTFRNVFENDLQYSIDYKNELESMFNGTYNGIPQRLDRIKGLGNAIVPQVAFQIFTAIDFVLREGEKKIINTGLPDKLHYEMQSKAIG